MEILLTFIRQLSKFTRITLIISILLIVYGYLCRAIGIYFFWESDSICWTMLCIGLIGLFSDRIKVKNKKNNKSTSEKVGIGIVVFSLFIQTVLFIVFSISDAFDASKQYIRKNESLREELGEIQGFGFTPTGSIETTTDLTGEHGIAQLEITVKGNKKYKDVTIYVTKTAGVPGWKVQSMD